MIDFALADTWSGQPAGALAPPPASRNPRTSYLCLIEELASEIARTSPVAQPQAEGILALVQEARDRAPTRDAIIEAIEGVCDDDLNGCCLSRIADAVMGLCRTR
ncbi:MAG TPA: hypothetical protein VIL65_10995 [Beijerinckiaceae bacterium]|jgi:hypothetical protein